jgi:PAS domain S-box-containing protein
MLNLLQKGWIMEAGNINRYLKSIINTMNDGLIVISPDGAILMTNTAFEQFTGYSADEVIGKPCTLLGCDACELEIKSEQGQIWCALFDPSHEGIKRCRCNIKKKDGTYTPALKNASVLRDEEGIPLGAVETLTDISELDRLDQEVVQLSRRLETGDGFYGIIGMSAAMQQVFDVIEKVATSDAPVVIYGESGTGKDLVARAIHQAGNRKNMPYVQFNCAALNESLLESELFGHTKGAFTGAYRHRIGRFEAANGGDIFLDEIGDIPLPIQVKLLRVLEAKEFERVGDNTPVSVDVRIISATNKNLQDLIVRKKFREDLFFRINAIAISLPPLRERTEDIPLLAGVFIRRLQEKDGKPISGLTPSAMERFMAYPWPGNVRELKSALDYAFILAEKGLIGRDHLPPHIAAANGGPTPFTRVPAGNQTLHSDGTVTYMQNHQGAPEEKTALINALRQSGGNQSEAARILGINRVTVWNRMKKYGIDLKRVMTV